MGFEHEDFLEIAGLMSLLIMIVLVAYTIRKFQFYYLHESGFAIILGMVIGGVFQLITTDATTQRMTSFSPQFFFMVLLPPIIFSSGYGMKRKKFFLNLGTISAYAFGGTLVSFLSTSSILWALGKVGAHEWETGDCFLFGALISATDPVTVLSILETFGLDENLFSIVLGESILNDAVAIVLFEICFSFVEKGKTATALTILEAGGSFVGILVGSIFIGMVLGAGCSLLLKHVNLREHAVFERSLIVLTAYTSYFFSEGVGLSGIVTILFNGITLAHYAYNNLMPESRVVTKHAFEFIAFIAETFVFIYLGFALFTFRMEFDIVIIIAVIPVCLLTRAMHIFPLGLLLGKAGGGKSASLRPRVLVFLWFAGLRGAIAFALSLRTREITEKGHAIVTTTLVVIYATVFVCGGMSHFVLSRLGLMEDRPADDEGQPSQGDTPAEVITKREALFHRIDRQYIKPFLTDATGVLGNADDSVVLTEIDVDAEGSSMVEAPDGDCQILRRNSEISSSSDVAGAPVSTAV